MKKILIPVLLVGVLFLFGCPLETKYSIDSGSYEAPAWLVGRWTAEKEVDGKIDSYQLENISGNSTAMESYPVDGLGVNKYGGRKIIFSAVGDKIFVSVYDAGSLDDDSKAPGYYLYLFNKISDTEIELVPLKEAIEETKLEQGELKNWVQEHKDDAGLLNYDEAMKYMKQ